MMDSGQPPVAPPVRPESPAVRSVFMTGVTGFMGRLLATALLERHPECVVWALVRPREEHGGTPEARPELGNLAGIPG